MVIKNKINDRTFYFNEILSKWIAHHTNMNIKSINPKRLLWFSTFLVFIHDHWQEIIKYYPAQTKCKPSYELYSTLSNRLLLTLKTDIIYDLPKTRFFNITGYIRLFISSLITTFSVIKSLKNKQKIVTTNKVIKESFNIPLLRSYGDLIFSDIYILFKRRSARRKLKLFLSNNLAGFDIELLVKIIPSCLVELLPIYQKISSKLSINEIHTWVMDIYMCRFLLINCLFNKEIKLIGYQHGGGYGYRFDEWTEAEMNFYDHFKYWGYSKDTIHPFKFRTKKDHKDNFFNPNPKAINTINFFLDCCVATTFCTGFTDIKNMSNKLDLMGINLNIVLHPTDYKFTTKKINKSKVRSKIYISSKEIIFDSNAIYFVSIFSTLFWKIIDNKLPFICFKGSDLISLTNYHFKISKLMEENKIIYEFNDLTKLLSKELLNEIIPNNQIFYKEIEKL